MLENIINKYALHGNWIDLMLLILIGYFMISQKGFINTFLEILAFIFALIFSFKSYSFFAQLLIVNFSLTPGISNAVGFVISWFLAELIFSVIILQFIEKKLTKYKKHPINIIFGYFVSIIQAGFIFLFFVSFIFAFPVRGQIKEAILESKTGPYFVNFSRSLELGLKNIFGGAINDTLNFLTIKNESGETVNLGFKRNVKDLSIDPQSEETMYTLVNQERTSRGLKALTFDTNLRSIARNYAMQMFENGFFSHVSELDGSSPGDRASKAGVNFTVYGENLAYAPDVYIAHQGLMNSEGHRKNILSPEYNKIGVGVVDGNIYGRIFVQEFSN